jgi:hypothetical protein
MNYHPILNEQRQEALMAEAQEFVDRFPDDLSALQALDREDVKAILDRINALRNYFRGLRFDLTPTLQRQPVAERFRNEFERWEQKRTEEARHQEMEENESEG